MQEMWVRSLGGEESLEKEMATHSSILAWEIPWAEEPGGLQSMGSQRVRHNLATKQHPGHHNYWWAFYWVGQKVHQGFPVTSYKKAQMNFLANPIQGKFLSPESLGERIKTPA